MPTHGGAERGRTVAQPGLSEDARPTIERPELIVRESTSPA